MRVRRNSLMFDFQSPFHRGNGCNSLSMTISPSVTLFQSPFHRGNGCNDTQRASTPEGVAPFSPLFIGVTVVTTGSNSRYEL